MNRKNINLGDYIKKRYLQLGFESLDQLANRIGVSRTTLHNWTKNTTDIKVHNLIRLARAIQVHPVEVLRLVTREVISYPVFDHPVTRFDDSGFIDETVPDNTVVGSGAVFEKIWIIQNIGSIPWVGRRLICQDDCEQLYVLREGGYVPFRSCMLIPNTSNLYIPDTRPGETVELSVRFTASVMPGRAISIWQMVNDRGEICFPKKPGIWCQVVITGFM
ncbi:hypothetical protein AB833_17150 [Chromatiales bacterium (ex Bugula neritina AB1)]|nr:hypothetical protein AB833_17150 [Chromatiales bacterium (ex Bugula neritina AB1)]